MGEQLRVVSWNIERGYRPAATAARLVAAEADLYLLTELDRGNKRTAGVDMVRVLEEALAGSITAPAFWTREFRELDSIWRAIIRQGGPGGGEHGNAILSRRPLLAPRSRPLPTAAPLHWRRTTWIPELFEPREGGRRAQIAELELDGRTLTIVNTHLENWRCGWEHRRRQLEAALAGLDTERMILAGDMNPLGGVLRTIGSSAARPVVNAEVRQLRAFLAERGLRDPFPDEAATIFEWGVRSKFDWLAIGPGLKASELVNERTGLSDHNLLAATITLS